MAVSSEQVAEFMAGTVETMTEELGSPQVLSAGLAGVAGGVAMGVFTHRIEQQGSHTETSTLTGAPKELPVEGVGTELLVGGLGFAIAATATYLGIKNWALRHITSERYKELKRYMLDGRSGTDDATK